MEFYDMKESASESLPDGATQTTTTTTDETVESKTGDVVVEVREDSTTNGQIHSDRELMFSMMGALDGLSKHRSGTLTDKNNPGNNGMSSEKNEDTSRFWRKRVAGRGDVEDENTNSPESVTASDEKNKDTPGSWRTRPISEALHGFFGIFK